MQEIKNLIANNQDRFPLLDYYLLHVEDAEKHKLEQPDRCIETCSALMEGVCKTVLRTLDNAYDDRHVEGLKIKRLVEKTLQEVARFDEEIEAEFPNKFAELVQELATIRNKRGDIAHGRGTPKLEASNSRFSRFLFRQTESAVMYLLESLVAIDLTLPKEIKYEDNPEFNESLDSGWEESLAEFSLVLDIKYSEALFAQDKVDYEQRLQAYLDLADKFSVLIKEGGLADITFDTEGEE